MSLCADNKITPRSFSEYKYSRYFVYLDYQHQLNRSSSSSSSDINPTTISDPPFTSENYYSSLDDDWQEFDTSLSKDLLSSIQSAMITPESSKQENCEITNNPVMDVVGDVIDNEEGYEARIPDYILNDKTETTDIKEYLERYVELYSFTWNESDAQFSSFIYGYKPLLDWANLPAVKRKLQNYAFIRCDLELKIMINASPFYYGEMYISFEPLQGNKASVGQDSTKLYAMNFSQLPHVRISPQDSKGATFVLPYLAQAQFLRLGSSGNLGSFGWLRAINYTELRSANGVTGAGATVTIYCRPRNLILSGATIELPLQADSFGERPISKTASAVASALGFLGRVPIIGKYATAASMVANGIAGGAEHLGYTNHPNIDNIDSRKIASYPPLASTEVDYPFEPLTIDPKNSLTIDQSILGLPDKEDPLAVQKIVQRESFFFNTDWTTSAVPGDLLCSIAVTPCHFRQGTQDGTTIVQSTVTNHIAQCFNYWRGDLIYRFKVVASPFHKGRLRLSFDPSGQSGTNIQNTAANVGIVYNSIIDLGKTNEVSFRVPYAQYFPWLSRHRLVKNAVPTMQPDSTTGFLHIPGETNGVLTLRVVNALTAPVATAPVTILVSVKGADNLEFASPDLDKITSDISVSLLPPQSKNVAIDCEEKVEVAEEVTIGSPTVFNPSQYLLNHGEAVTNLRQLFHRMYFSTLLSGNNGASSVDEWNIERYNVPSFPLGYGYAHTGSIATTSRNQANSANVNFSWSTLNPITWWMPCFAGHRGGFLWNYHLTDSDRNSTMYITRVPEGMFSANYYAYTSNAIPKANIYDSSSANYQIAKRYPHGAGGSCGIDRIVTPSVSIKAPMYTNLTYLANNPFSNDFATQQSNTLVVTIPPSPSNLAKTYLIDVWVGGGEDFTPVFFLCTPTVYFYSNEVLPPT